MTLSTKRWRGGAAAVLLTGITTFIPAPARAAEDASRPATGVLTMAVKRAASVTPARGRISSGAPRRQSNGQSGSFFKSKPGILALAVMVAGTGYAIYSTQNDRIKSPGK